jgi:hypothetical protein
MILARNNKKSCDSFLVRGCGGVSITVSFLCVFADWIQAVQALMVLSVLFCFFSLIAFLYQLFRLVKGGRFFFTAVFQILASKCDLIVTPGPRPSAHVGGDKQ